MIRSDCCGPLLAADKDPNVQWGLYAAGPGDALPGKLLPESVERGSRTTWR